jgi:hypothetical protein
MTLIEVMIASSLMTLVLAAILSANYFGFRENQFMQSKAGASNTSRQAVNQFLNDIRSAKGYQIGNLSVSNVFIPITNGLQQGMALQLYPILISSNLSVDTTKYVLYYFNTSDIAHNDAWLWRYTSTNQTHSVAASNLFSTLFFSSEDYMGNVQNTRTYKGVIHTTLQFSEFLYPLTKVGTSNIFNYYRMDCRATPHLPDGP